MIRLTCALGLFILACLLAGAYGMAHNQVSYSVSSEYFTAFKFKQFNIDPLMSARQGAAMVGWQASWWMGIVIGLFVIPFGLLIRDTFDYCIVMLRVFALVLFTTFAIGMLGLAISYLVITPNATRELSIYGQSISNPVAFLRAGMMHNSSYVGGLFGIVVGMLSILRSFLRTETGSAKIWS